MATSLNELLAPKTKEEFRAELLRSIAGVGYVKKTVGTAQGSASSSGAAEGNYSVRVKITTAGTLGTAQMQVSTDGGGSYASAVTIPSNGVYSVAGTGLTLTFSVPGGATGHTFEVGDSFAVEVETPTLPSAAWAAGSTPLTILEKDAVANEDLLELVIAIAKGGYLTYARGAWLDVVIQEQYGLERRNGVAAVGVVRLTDAAGTGPHAIAIGSVWVATASGLRFTNTAGGTLAQDGTLDLAFRAESIGAAYNVGISSITRLLTSLPGVTVTNLAAFTDGTSNETDAQAIVRAKSRWPALAVNTPVEDAYDLWAKTASASVTQTKVRPSSSVPGTTEVFLAGGGGAVGAGVINDVDEYIQPRLPLGTYAEVASADEYPLTIEATVYTYAGQSAAASVTIAANLSALISGGKNSIGEELPGIKIGGTIYLTDIIEQIQIVPGVRNTDLTLPADDVELGETEVAVLTQDITMAGV